MKAHEEHAAAEGPDATASQVPGPDEEGPDAMASRVPGPGEEGPDAMASRVTGPDEGGPDAMASRCRMSSKRTSRFVRGSDPTPSYAREQPKGLGKKALANRDVPRSTDRLVCFVVG
jgi:hypothetical protein